MIPDSGSDAVALTEFARADVDALDAAALRDHEAEDPFDQKQLTQTLTQLHATLVEYAAAIRRGIVGDCAIRNGERAAVEYAAA